MKNAESADQLAIILTLEGEKKLGRTWYRDPIYIKYIKQNGKHS